jgi:uncharacterized repeat protein (TIGR03803 family)
MEAIFIFLKQCLGAFCGRLRPMKHMKTIGRDMFHADKTVAKRLQVNNMRPTQSEGCMKIFCALFMNGWRRVATAVIAFCLAWPAQGGVNFTTIHSFSALMPSGYWPESPLTLGNDGNWYGVAYEGGTYGLGTAFTMTPNGVVTVLHSFTGGNDGAHPRGKLVQGTNGNFYGTAAQGGSNNDGTIFMITPQGVLTPLYSFEGQIDGASPYGGLVLATNGTFYGTAAGGGEEYDGTVFQMTPDGVVSRIYSFTGGADGGSPLAGLVQGADGGLYGTTTTGGDTASGDSIGYGTIFSITTNGSLTPLYAFTDGNDGETPYSGLVQGMDGNFYGTAIHGGAGCGCVFQVSPAGGFNLLYDFGGVDGCGPIGTLIQGADANLYGTTLGGGTNDAGTIFQITTNGAFTSLYSFVNTSTGFPTTQGPFAGLAQGSNGNLYGATLGGGDGFGTIFMMTTNEVLTSLYSFPGGGGDGAYPRAALFADTNGSIYGTTREGGTNGNGAIFQIAGSGLLSALYSFTNGSDGANPFATLVPDANGDLWGTTSDDFPLTNGVAPYGTVFRITTNGTLTTIYTFTNGIDGATPVDGVIRGFDGNFYGTCISNTFFRITPGGAFTNLYLFNAGAVALGPLLEANDNNFYGTTSEGTIFKMTPEGVYSVIYKIANGSFYGALIQGADGNLYGTSTAGNGTVFRLTLPNTFTNLYSFTNGMDGATPLAGLLQASDGNFYGTTSAGGLNGNGTVFRIRSTGSFQALYSFSSEDEFGFNNDGAYPAASLIQDADGDFYGVAEEGGQFGTGTVFKLTLTPPAPPEFLSATESAGTLNFIWSAEAGSQYQLQYTTNLAQTTWTNLGAVMSATGSIVAGSDVSPADAQRFYRVLLLP